MRRSIFRTSGSGLLACVALLGCVNGAGDDDLASIDASTSDAGAAPDATGSDADVRTVEVSAGRHYLAPSDEDFVPDVLSTASVSVLVHDGQGGFVELPSAAGPRPATSAFRRCHAAPITCAARTANVVTDADAVDLSGFALGRPPVYPSQPTPVTVAGEGMSPWTAGCVLELFSPTAGEFLYGLENLAAVWPARRGAVDLELSLDWLSLGQPLIDAAGDECTVVQLVPQAGPGSATSYRVTRAFSGACTVSDGQAGLVRGTFVDAPEQTIDLRWQRDSFFDALGSFGSGERAPSIFLSLATAPRADEHFAGSGFPDLLAVLGGLGDGDLDAELSYGDPFPPDWPRFIWVDALASIAVPIGDLGTIFVVNQARAVVPLGETSIAARLSVPRGLTIDGQDASGPVAVTSPTPTVAWQAPALGQATDYQLDVYHVASTSSFGVYLAATIYTRATSVALPPGILLPNDHYLISVRAYARSGIDASRTPYWQSLPYHTAGTWTKDLRFSGPAPCSVDATYPGGTMPATISAFESSDLGAVIYLAPFNDDRDSLLLELFAGYGVFEGGIVPGTYVLTGDELNYATCGVCVRFIGDETPSGWDDFLATGGHVEITEVGPPGGRLEARLDIVGFEHVTIAPLTFESTPVGDACTTSFAAEVIIDAPIEGP